MKLLIVLAVLVVIVAVAVVCRAIEPAQPPSPPASGGTGQPVVIMKTNKGDVRIELFQDKAPVTVENFLKYVDEGFYKGTIFHRVIPGFMIQGGGFTPAGVEKPTRPPIKNEAGNGVKNKRGTLAMARTSIIDSATSQFFINVVDNAFLDHSDETPRGFGYCAFGRVIGGMEVVDAIRSVATGQHGPHGDWPVETVEILDMVREGAAE